MTHILSYSCASASWWEDSLPPPIPTAAICCILAARRFHVSPGCRILPPSLPAALLPGHVQAGVRFCTGHSEWRCHFLPPRTAVEVTSGSMAGKHGASDAPRSACCTSRVIWCDYTQGPTPALTSCSSQREQESQFRKRLTCRNTEGSTRRGGAGGEHSLASWSECC